MLYNFWPAPWNILTQTVVERDAHRLRLSPLKFKSHQGNSAALAVNLLKQSDVNYEKLFFVRLVFITQLESCCFQSFWYQFKGQNPRDEIFGISLIFHAIFCQRRDL